MGSFFDVSRAMNEHDAGNAEADRVAESVRAFYERHPYPPPVDDLDRYKRTWDDSARRRVESHLFWPTEPCRDDRSVLVAGCGTSQAAKYALRWPHASVTGIDVSANSIERTERLKRKYGLDNLGVRQLAVEHAGELGRRFGLVVSTGVLHHLPDPAAGLRSLRDVLEPGGAMHLMVYAPYGRAGVYMLQQYCRMLGIGATTPEIRDLAASLRALPPDHPLVPLLRHAPDFRDEAGLADALLHPQDRSYSVPQLFEFIRDAGLQFGRWLRQAPYLPQCGALASSPHQPLLGRLSADEQFAAVELFRGTMVRHSAIVFRNDMPGDAQPIRFDGEAWRSYVPLRVPDTVCVEERLPPGAAAVLINRTHTFTDLYLPVDVWEKRLFDAIDGARTIGEIASAREPSGVARTLFERLWWYDQVVFDASRSQGVR
jgi:SAM-dependent methyltransferase